MALEISIRQLTKSAHNLDSFPDIDRVDLSKVGLNAEGRDVLGRPYFMDVKLNSAKLKREWRLPFEPLVSLSSQKKLVISELTGGGDTDGGIVIEDIAPVSYNITMRGILMETDRTQPRYPAEQVETLRRFYETREALDVECDLLELFGIRSLVIKSMSIDDMAGRPYSQRYTLNCISYRDFLAELKFRGL